MTYPRPSWFPEEPQPHRPLMGLEGLRVPPRTFDEMYGKGSLAQLKKLLKAKAEQAGIDGGCRLALSWRGASAQLDCWPDRVHWLMLSARGEAKYDLLIEHVPKFLKDRGVRLMTAATNEHIEAKGKWDAGIWVL